MNSGAIKFSCLLKVSASSHIKPDFAMCLSRMSLSSSGTFFPVGVMLPVLAKQMIEIALPLVATKVKAKPFFEGALLG